MTLRLSLRLPSSGNKKLPAELQAIAKEKAKENVDRVVAELTLQRLVAMAQDGDTDAFAQLYDHFFLPVYRYTAFRLPPEMTEDVVADVFVKAWEKLGTYRVQRGVPFGAWIFRIARHTIIDAYRKERHFEEIPDDLMDPDSLNRADARVHKNDLLRIVRHALDQLPRRYREILLLSYVADLPHTEVARVLHLTSGAVRILKFRALRKLQAFLPPEWREEA